MRISNLFMMSLLSAVAFTSCTDNDDNSVWDDTNNVVFNSQIKGVQSRVNDSSWDNGDEIGIFMQTESVEVANKKYTAQTNGTLTATAGNELHYPAEGAANFLAYYPFNAATNGKSVSLSVADQANPSKNDFLYSNNATAIKNGQTVNLEFSHQLSNIVVNVTYDETLSSAKGLNIVLGGMNTTATFNLADGKLAANDSKANINMNVNAEGSKAQAIILPTTAEATMTFKLNTMSFEHALKAPDAKGFEAGYKYTYNATLSIFNGQPSIKLGDATITDWTDKAGGNIDVDFEGGGDKPATSKVLLEENFDANQGEFTITNIALPEGSDYVWKWATHGSEKFMKASAHIGKNDYASEAWLVSPALELPRDKVTLDLVHSHAYCKEDSTKEMTLLIATAGTKITKEATGWTKLIIPAYSSKNYEFVNGSIDLSAYKGQKIQFAFRYVSTTSSAPTWQINTVKVYTGEGGKTPNPDPNPEPTPGEDGILFNETFGVPVKDGKYWPSVDKYTGWTDTHKMTYSDPVMTGSYSNASVRSTSTMDGHVWFSAKGNSDKDYSSALKISGFKTTGYKNLTLTYEIAANQPGEQSIIEVSTDKGKATVPYNPITETNKYQFVTITLPAGITYIQFYSDQNKNAAGYRIDNVKVVGNK